MRVFLRKFRKVTAQKVGSLHHDHLYYWKFRLNQIGSSLLKFTNEIKKQTLSNLKSRPLTNTNIYFISEIRKKGSISWTETNEIEKSWKVYYSYNETPSNLNETKPLKPLLMMMSSLDSLSMLKCSSLCRRLSREKFGKFLDKKFERKGFRRVRFFGRKFGLSWLLY